MGKSNKLTARKFVYNGDDGEKLFDVHWNALRISFHRHQKGKGNLKVLNRLKRALVGISNKKSSDQLGEVRELITSEPQTLILHGSEFDKLKQVVADEEIPWSMEMGEDVEYARDHINKPENWPEIELEEAVKPTAEE